MTVGLLFSKQLNQPPQHLIVLKYLTMIENKERVDLVKVEYVCRTKSLKQATNRHDNTLNLK